MAIGRRRNYITQALFRGREFIGGEVTGEERGGKGRGRGKVK